MKVSRRDFLSAALAASFAPSAAAAADQARDPATRTPPSSADPDLDTFISAVAFSPDGRTIAAGGKALRLWDIRTGRPREMAEKGAGELSALAFAPNGRFIACGSGQAANMWLEDVGHDRLAWRSMVGGPVDTLAFAHDGRSLLVGGLPFDFKLLDVGTGRQIADFNGHEQSVAVVAFSPDDRSMASGAGDNTVKLWGVNSGEVLATLPAGSTPTAIAFTPDGRSVLWTTKTDTGAVITRADAHSRKIVQSRAMPAKHPATMTFSADARVLAISDDDKLALLDTATGKPVRVIQSKGHYLGSLAFSPDARLIAQGKSGNTVDIWETSSGSHLTTLK